MDGPFYVPQPELLIPAEGMTVEQIDLWRERSKPKVYGVLREQPREARRPAHNPE